MNDQTYHLDDPHHQPRGSAPRPPHRAASAPIPPPRRNGTFRTVTRVFGSIMALAGAIMVGLIAGFYLGLFTVASQQGFHVQTYRAGDGEQRIAILPVEGMIDDDTAQFVRRAAKHLRNDTSIKALVLRVNSPGGGVTAADEIWHHLTRLRAERALPIVASYGPYAASGGYYISALADHIYIQPTTVTGSIGVIAQAFTLQTLLEKKLGIQPEIIAATQATEKDTLSPFRDWTEEDRARLRVMLDAAHARFMTIVDDGRVDLNHEQVAALATGEVFTAAQALANGLVDAEGYLDDALAKARQLAGIDPSQPPVVIFRRTGGLGEVFGIRRPESSFAWNMQTARAWLTEMSLPRVLYLMYP